MKQIPPDHPLHKTFRQALGFATSCTPSFYKKTKGVLIPYIRELLLRFMYVENLYKIKDARGKGVTEVAQMLLNKSFHEEIKFRQYIGDYTLFILGIFPESLKNIKEKDKFLLRCGELLLPFSSVHDYYTYYGRRSYLFVAEELSQRYREEASIFFLLHRYFPECVQLLSLVRTWLDACPLFERIKRLFF